MTRSSSSTGKGTPDDGLERRFYTPLSLFGPVFTLLTNAWIFGTWGLAMWLFEMAWIPFFAAGVINGLGHWWGYRNFSTPDESRNLPGQYLVDPDLWRGAPQQPSSHPELAVASRCTAASSIRVTGIFQPCGRSVSRARGRR